jgi:hypothetical protein
MSSDTANCDDVGSVQWNHNRTPGSTELHLTAVAAAVLVVSKTGPSCGLSLGLYGTLGSTWHSHAASFFRVQDWHHNHRISVVALSVTSEVCPSTALLRI